MCALYDQALHLEIPSVDTMSTNPLLDSITTIDCFYVHEKKMAAYLIIEGGRATFVDNNTRYAIPHLLKALEEKGLTPEQVDYAIITHVHLDHAGGSFELLKACPNATLLAHPTAARNIIAPERLVAGSKVVYGEERFLELYGDVEGVPEERVRVIEDGEVLPWGDRQLKFFYTRGHASHHMCIFDSKSNTVFSGDSFGVGRTWVENGHPPCQAATASPPQFNASEAKKDVQSILNTDATQVAPAHFGIIEDVPTAARQVLHSLQQHEDIEIEASKTSLPDDELEAWCYQRIYQAMGEHITACGVKHAEADLVWLQGDMTLNAQGLAVNAAKRRNARDC
jgi:glyoxylase-like metal-dependent hydrolase (beta-lactamase superfamily II)